MRRPSLHGRTCSGPCATHPPGLPSAAQHFDRPTPRGFAVGWISGHPVNENAPAQGRGVLVPQVRQASELLPVSVGQFGGHRATTRAAAGGRGGRSRCRRCGSTRGVGGNRHAGGDDGAVHAFVAGQGDLVGFASDHDFKLIGALFLNVATSTSFINFGAFTAFTLVNLSVIGYFIIGYGKAQYREV